EGGARVLDESGERRTAEAAGLRLDDDSLDVDAEAGGNEVVRDEVAGPPVALGDEPVLAVACCDCREVLGAGPPADVGGVLGALLEREHEVEVRALRRAEADLAAPGRPGGGRHSA